MTAMPNPETTDQLEAQLAKFAKAANEFLRSPEMKALHDGIIAGAVAFVTEGAKVLRASKDTSHGR